MRHGCATSRRPSEGGRRAFHRSAVLDTSIAWRADPSALKRKRRFIRVGASLFIAMHRCSDVSPPTLGFVRIGSRFCGLRVCRHCVATLSLGLSDSVASSLHAYGLRVCRSCVATLSLGLSVSVPSSLHAFGLRVCRKSDSATPSLPHCMRLGCECVEIV